MLTPEQQADYDYAMSLLKSEDEDIIIDFSPSTRVIFTKELKEKFRTAVLDSYLKAEAEIKINNKVYGMFGIPNSIFQGATSAQDSNPTK